MRNLRQALPSLGALVAFETAARHASFTQAAHELGVTQAAVSRRVRELEHDLGAVLFVRAHRAVQLTEAGTILGDACARSFSTLTTAVEAIRTMRSDGTLTVGVSLAFAHFRLLPALSGLNEKYPDLTIRVVSQDTWAPGEERGLDVALRYGSAPFPGRTTVAALGEVVRPVCSPTFRERFGLCDTEAIDLDDILKLPLIDCDPLDTSWLSWSKWLARLEASRDPPRPVMRFTSYSDAAYAAMNGEGVALGWQCLLQRPLSDGRLVTIGEHAVRPEESHHLLVTDDRRDSEHVTLFAQWLSDTLQDVEGTGPSAVS